MQYTVSRVNPNAGWSERRGNPKGLENNHATVLRDIFFRWLTQCYHVLIITTVRHTCIIRLWDNAFDQHLKKKSKIVEYFK